MADIEGFLNDLGDALRGPLDSTKKDFLVHALQYLNTLDHLSITDEQLARYVGYFFVYHGMSREYVIQQTLFQLIRLGVRCHAFDILKENYQRIPSTMPAQIMSPEQIENEITRRLTEENFIGIGKFVDDAETSGFNRLDIIARFPNEYFNHNLTDFVSVCLIVGREVPIRQFLNDLSHFPDVIFSRKCYDTLWTRLHQAKRMKSYNEELANELMTAVRSQL